MNIKNETATRCLVHYFSNKYQSIRERGEQKLFLHVASLKSKITENTKISEIKHLPDGNVVYTRLAGGVRWVTV